MSVQVTLCLIYIIFLIIYIQMKNINSKSFKQYQNSSSNKRAISPLLGSTNPQVPQHSNSNPKSGKKKIITNSPYQKNIKQFDTYGKAQKKKISNYLQSQSAQHNKFRIVTQPVQERIMHIAQSNIFNSSLAIKNRKIQTQAAEPAPQIRLNLRQPNSQSKSRQKTYISKNMNIYGGESQEVGQRYQQRQRSRQSINTTKCKNCAKFSQQLQFLNIQIKKIIKTKQLWKGGEITYQEALEVFRGRNEQINFYHDIKTQDHSTVGKGIQRQSSNKGTYSHNSLQSLQKNISLQHRYSSPHITAFKFADNIVNQIKSTITNLIAEIQSLTSIDYPKMLQMQIFKFQPTYNDYIDNQQNELKELFGQLRMGVEGKINDYDTYDTESENNYVKKIMRNMKSRLSYTLRENLQLRICKAIYEKSQQISEQSEEYLRKVIQQVLQNYLQKPKFNHRDKQKEQKKQKQKGKIVKRS